MRFIIDNRIADLGMRPAAILLAEVDDPLRYSSSVAELGRSLLQAQGDRRHSHVLRSSGSSRISEHETTGSALNKLRRQFAQQGWISSGVVIDAANYVSLKNDVDVIAHAFDAHYSEFCNLKLFIADEAFFAKFGYYGEEKARPALGDLVYAVECLDCRSSLHLITVLGSRNADMPAFRIHKETRQIIVTVLGGLWTDPGYNDSIAQSAVDLMRANTTVIGVEPSILQATDIHWGGSDS
jgi:hypothetical protein